MNSVKKFTKIANFATVLQKLRKLWKLQKITKIMKFCQAINFHCYISSALFISGLAKFSNFCYFSNFCSFRNFCCSFEGLPQPQLHFLVPFVNSLEKFRCFCNFESTVAKFCKFVTFATEFNPGHISPAPTSTFLDEFLFYFSMRYMWGVKKKKRKGKRSALPETGTKESQSVHVFFSGIILQHSQIDG